MFEEYIHISDEELLQRADGELSSSRESDIEKHLAACWSCRAQVGELEETISDFVRAYRDESTEKIGSSGGSRLLFKARLAEAAEQVPPLSRWSFLQSTISGGLWAYVCAGVLLVVLATQARHLHVPMMARSESSVPLATIIPNSQLTPGAVRPVALKEICSVPYSDKNRVVDTSLGQRIFKEYGMAGVHPKDYEVDYLITPELGGAEDIRNLWPEPYASTEWNAGVKDALEDRLHELVCQGKVDLSTAQREIATNWISAYQKYFDTTKPLSTPLPSSTRNDEDQVLVADSKNPSVPARRVGRLINLMAPRPEPAWSVGKTSRKVDAI